VIAYVRKESLQKQRRMCVQERKNRGNKRRNPFPSHPYAIFFFSDHPVSPLQYSNCLFQTDVHHEAWLCASRFRLVLLLQTSRGRRVQSLPSSIYDSVSPDVSRFLHVRNPDRVIVSFLLFHPLPPHPFSSYAQFIN
jgi:hypothetical protein